MLKIVNPRLGRASGFPPASAIYYDNSTSDLPDNVQGAIKELYDKSSIIDGEVDYYSDLPTASEHIGETYLVKLYSVLTPTKLTGLYYCDGSTWDRRSDKVVYSSTAFTSINKLVKTNDNNRQVIETEIEIDANNNIYNFNNIMNIICGWTAEERALFIEKTELISSIYDSKKELINNATLKTISSINTEF